MNRKLKLTLLLVLVGIAVLLTSGAIAETQSSATKPGRHQVIAYCFHTNTRCSTCIQIEQFSPEAIEQGFPNELKNGALGIRPAVSMLFNRFKGPAHR